jgi:aminocarboxymuconate-semialdehyde decarboxylase
MPVIDVHCHVVPKGFPAAPSACCAAHWPSMRHRDDGKSVVSFGAKEFRVLDPRSWDVARRTADMDREQVDVQAISPMPELLSYWMEVDDALAVARHVNGTIAEMVAAAPKRFVGFGMVPLQDPERAARELSGLRRDGMIGIEIGSNINDKPPGDPMFDPFWAEAERLGMPVFVHSLHPVGTDRVVGSPRLVTFLNFPVDTGFTAASLVTGRTLEKFPGLRVAFSHGGGTFGAVLPRLTMGWERSPELQASFKAPAAIARRFYYDDLVFDHDLLRHLIGVFGLSQVMIGTDYPYDAGQTFPVAFLDAMGLGAGELAALHGGNAARFLGGATAGA